MREYLATQDTQFQSVGTKQYIHYLIALAMSIEVIRPAGLSHAKTIDSLFFVIPLKDYIRTGCGSRKRGVLPCRKDFTILRTGAHTGGGCCQRKVIR